MKKKEPTAITAAKISVVGPVIVAIIGCISALVIGYWQFVLKPNNPNPSTETEYIGRVLDVNTQLPISGAKITLDLEGVPPIVYSDSEGVYRFNVAVNSDISGQVRVDAQNYQTYTRFITLSSQIQAIEDIRLIPAQQAVDTVVPTSTIVTSTGALTLDVRKADPNEAAGVLISIWDVNNISVNDILSPGKKSYSGNAQVGVEYIFPVYWCATTETILAENRNNIKTEFFLNGEQIPDEFILAYGYKDKDGWRCINTSITLSGWTSGEAYNLQIKRQFKVAVFDGKTKYPAGTYIYELTISVR